MDRTRGQKRDGGQILRLFASLVGQYRGKRNVGGEGKGDRNLPRPFLSFLFSLARERPSVRRKRK